MLAPFDNPVWWVRVVCIVLFMTGFMCWARAAGCPWWAVVLMCSAAGGLVGTWH